MVRYPKEHSRGGGFSTSMRRFSDVVEDLELRDFSFQEGPFNWKTG